MDKSNATSVSGHLAKHDNCQLSKLDSRSSALPSRRGFVKTIGAGIAACTFLSSSPTTLVASETNSGKPTTQKLIVFKDGYSLVVKELKAKTDSKGRVILTEVPEEAILGSFWATSTTGNVKGMSAGWNKANEVITKSIPCATRIEVLFANKGKPAKIALKKETYEGVIKDVLVEKSKVALTLAQHQLFGVTYLEPDHPHAIRPKEGEELKKYSQDVLDSSTVTAIVGNQVVIDTENGDVLLNVEEIKTVSVENMTTVWDRELAIPNRMKQIEIRMQEADSEQVINLMYFRPGLRWIPTYRLQIPQETKDELIAQLEMQAELVNQAEDFESVPFDIVVGVPNFRFRDTVSPLILENQMRSAVTQADPFLGQQIAMNNFSNSIVSQGFRNDPQNAAPEVVVPGEISGEKSQDLFVYHLETMSLKKGERSAERVMRTSAPLRHVYTADIKVGGIAHSVPHSESNVDSPLNVIRNDVWHQLTLTNKSDVPWTTGAVMVMQEGQPVAQELLTYTSIGSEVRVPLTVAVDVSATSSDVETARETEGVNIFDLRFVKVTKKATFKVHNKKNEKIVFELKADLPGKAKSATRDGKIEIQGFSPEDWEGDNVTARANNHSVVKWRTELEPKGEFEVEVEYQNFVRY